MRYFIRTCAVAVMVTCMAGNALAAIQSGCARPDDGAAVKAATQQRLILTALICDTTHSYNSRVLAFLWLIKEKAHVEGYQAFNTRGLWRTSATSPVVAQAQISPVISR